MRHLTIPVKGDRLNIYPINDVQLGAQGCAVNEFEEYVREAADDPFGRVLGIGDYIDGVSPSNRKLLLANFVRGELYDTARDALDSYARDKIEAFKQLVAPTRKQWDAVLSGHHFWEYGLKAGDARRNTDTDLAHYVNAPYGEAGELGAITYVFPGKGKMPESHLRVLFTHGQGGGSGSFASPLNQLEKLSRGFPAEVFIIAHHHKLVAARIVKLNENLAEPTQLEASNGLIVCAGSWLRGYMPDMVTYAEEGLMPPLATGAPIIHVVRRKDGTLRVRTEL